MVGLAILGMSHYIATKMGIIGFMRGLANDVANDGITANAVLPGLIRACSHYSRGASTMRAKQRNARNTMSNFSKREKIRRKPLRRRNRRSISFRFV
jgi:NAD(P)-dependent dehydrogenase (short-subunit alcohol dehydrogenase family)